ncbi:hypothetical protein BSL78_14235 [Apostichopus japonicus]|uniref:Uncharacterized protein n=1 Tax=Stichopus japonicus TaxID=307972 RepID=A0A2G8KLS3_STIJA|nr:hypothetical protein BSL78_14235 [Apostichopus japonicus]
MSEARSSEHWLLMDECMSPVSSQPSRNPFQKEERHETNPFLNTNFDQRDQNQSLYYTPYQRESHGYVPRTNNQFRYPGARVTANTPTYDGSTPWKDFLVQFEIVSELHGWSPLSMALNLAANLRGPAQALLADLPEEYRRNYQALTVALKQRFAPENQCELHKALLRNRSRKMTESLPELAQDLRRQVVKAYPDAPSSMHDALAKDYFVDCLQDPDTRWRVYQSRPTGSCHYCN